MEALKDPIEEVSQQTEDIGKYKEYLNYTNLFKFAGQKEKSLNESTQILPHYVRKDFASYAEVVRIFLQLLHEFAI